MRPRGSEARTQADPQLWIEAPAEEPFVLLGQVGPEVDLDARALGEILGDAEAPAHRGRYRIERPASRVEALLCGELMAAEPRRISAFIGVYLRFHHRLFSASSRGS